MLDRSSLHSSPSTLHRLPLPQPHRRFYSPAGEGHGESKNPEHQGDKSIDLRLAGVLIASRLNSAQPALGAGYELDAIAAVVIGGTSLSGGEGTILGTIIGAFIISTLTNGLRILGVPQEWQMVVTGVIVILAVYLDILRRRSR